jgi:NTP pyrophosphatase (non-canonical NTP hydrolase)
MIATFQELQAEQAPWAARNFGDVPAWQPLLGMIEEVGELFEVCTRVDEEDERYEVDAKDAIADLIIFSVDFANRMDLVLPSPRSEEWSPKQWVDTAEFVTAVAKIAHHYLKMSQGIRGTPVEHFAKIQRGLVYLYDVAERFVEKEFDAHLIEIVAPVWERVKQRDFRQYPKTGLPAEIQLQDE